MSTSRQTTLSDDSSASGSAKGQRVDFGKKHRKVIRILTVIAYIMSVSTVALLLSAYYIFLWNPTNRARGHKSATDSEFSYTSLAHHSLPFPPDPTSLYSHNIVQSHLDNDYSYDRNMKVVDESNDSEDDDLLPAAYNIKFSSFGPNPTSQKLQLQQQQQLSYFHPTPSKTARYTHTKPPQQQIPTPQSNIMSSTTPTPHQNVGWSTPGATLKFLLATSEYSTIAPTHFTQDNNDE